MADFKGGENLKTLKTVETSNESLLGGIKIKTDVDFMPKGKGGSAGGGDNNFLSALSTMQQTPQAQAGLPGVGGFKMDVQFGIATGIQTGTDKQVDQARAEMAASKYKEAINTLGHVLHAEPQHHEALFLKATCQAALDQFEPALVTLAPLRKNPSVKNRLATRIQALREDLRGKMNAPVLAEFQRLLAANQVGKAVARMKSLAELDPEAWLYHYLHAGSLMTAGQAQAALPVIDEGLKVCKLAERDQLVGLQKQVLEQLSKDALLPARKLFKQTKFADAKKHLRGLDPAVQAVPLCATFINYLAALEGKRAADVTPPGKADDVDALYWFLLEEEIQQVQLLAKAGQYETAERISQTAYGYVPRFPYVNYLYGACIYYRMGQLLEAKKLPTLDDFIATLERSRQLLRIGMQDIQPGPAKALEAEVGSLLGTLLQIRESIEAQKREAKPINDAIAEFQSIMAGAKNGVQSISHLDQIYRSMSSLREKLRPLARTVTSAEGKQVVQDLNDAVQQALQQLDNLRPGMKEAETVNALYTRLDDKTAEIKRQGGIKDYYQQQQVKTYIQSLKSDCERERRNLRDDGARKAVDQLIDILNQLLTQMG